VAKPGKRPLRIECMSYPSSYRFTKEHEWIEANGTEATIGITDHAQHLLGDIVFVDLPKIGTALKQKDSFGSVESVKAVSEVYAPASGEVTAVNEDLTSAPEKINEDANGTWLVKATLSDAAELDGLLSAEAYEQYVNEETGH
jgi:glycine cleavage system H protein